MLPFWMSPRLSVLPNTQLGHFDFTLREIDMLHDPEILKGRYLVAYIRCSDEKSDAERQRTAIRTWAEKHGLKISRWFEDIEGRNSRDDSEKRHYFQEMLRLIESNSVGGVVVDAIERLGFKDNHEFGYFIHIFRQHGCTGWATVEGNLNAVDPGSIFSNTAKTVGAKIETTNIARRNLSKKILDAKQGLYQGGYPPFGFDVVCFEKNEEVWRLVYDGGHHKRVKISADGNRQRYDGKGNFPSKDKGQELRIRPSIEMSNRLIAVKEMFSWFANENISPAQVATRLNRAGIKPQVGIAWNKQVVKALLQNPAYTGFPSFNKRAGSKFYEYVGGEAQPAPIEPGRMLPKKGRRRDRKDWVTTSEEQFEPIVDPAIYKIVQQKLNESSEKHCCTRTPRVESFWLRNFLYCGKCGLPMRAWNESKWRSYFCSTYGLYGKENPTGCRCHRVKADVIESIVMEYLTETGRKAAVLQASQSSAALVAGALEEYRVANELNLQAWRDLSSVVASFLEEGDQDIDIFGNRIRVTKEMDRILLPEGWSELDLYEHFTRNRQAELKSEIAAKEAKFNELFEQFGKLKVQRAIDQANDLMAKLDVEIKSLQAQLKPLNDEVHESWREVKRKIEAVNHARKAMKGSNFRQRSESLKPLIKRVVCHFRYSDVKAANQPKSFLDRVEIFPVVGDLWTYYPNGTQPALN